MKTLLIILLSVYSLQTFSNTKVVYDKELDNYQYPFKVKTFKLKSQKQDLKMRYMDIGKKNAKKVIVLLHGKNFSGYYWKDIANDLLKKNYRIIIPDQIGFGKSSKPEAYQYSFGQLGLNTKKLLDFLKISKIELVGHSMGGMLATTMAVDYVSMVSKLILINPIGLEYYGQYTKFKDTDFFYASEVNKTLDKARNYQKKNYYDGKWSDRYESLLVPMKGMLAGKDWKIIAWNNALTYGPIFSENIVAKFPLIKMKTFLIIGTRDKTGPGRGWLKDGVDRKLGDYKNLAKETHKLIKNSVLYELEGLGHMPQFEDYERFSKAFSKALEP